jgi:predicted transcriptional regulator
VFNGSGAGGLSSKEYKVSQYKLNSEGLVVFLGPLEVEVMNEIWSLKKAPLSVREVYESLRGKKEIAYTTVMSTMNLLYEKKLLKRKLEKGKGGHYYVYWTALSEEELKKSAVEQVIDSLIKNFGETVVNYILKEKNLDEKELKTMKELLEERLKSKE